MTLPFHTHKLLLLFFCGSITALTFAPYYWIGIAPITYSVLFWYLNQKQPKKSLFKIGFAFGSGLGIFSTLWITNALMIDGGRFFYLAPLSWIAMGVLFGLFIGLPAYFSGYFKIGVIRLLAFASLMTVFEWVRSWFLTGFPWNLTGAVWENVLPILQSASVVGVYGLTFITISACSTLAFLPKKKPLVTALLVLSALYGLGSWRLYNANSDTVWGIKLRLVQPNIAQTLKWDPKEAENSFMKLIHLSRQNNDKITHVIWPEAAVPFILNREPYERARLIQAVQQGGTLIVGGMRQSGPDTYANSLFVLNDLAEITAVHDKAHLVPFGEYVPFREFLPFEHLLPIAQDLTTSGKGIKTLTDLKTPAIGPLVCYEVIFSGRVTDSKKRPEWLVNLTNDGWYGDSAGPYQHLGMAKMRAVEEGLPLARAANTGITAVFDGYGRAIGQTQLNTSTVLDTDLPTALPPTLYSRLGIWIPVGFSLLLLIFLRIRQKQ